MLFKTDDTVLKLNIELNCSLIADLMPSSVPNCENRCFRMGTDQESGAIHRKNSTPS